MPEKFASYSAAFTPVNFPNSEFSSGQAFRRYQSEMTRRLSRLAEFLLGTRIMLGQIFPGDGPEAGFYILGGLTQIGDDYIFGRRISSAGYPPNGSAPVWMARYEVVAGSEDEGFIKELQQEIESGELVDVVKSGSASNIFVARDDRKIWMVGGTPGELGPGNFV